jgi:hypothetical protein
MSTEASAEAPAQAQAGDAQAKAGASPARKATSSGADRRAHQRATVVWKGRIVLSNQQVMDARVVDVSEAGCGLEAERSFPVSTVLSLMIAVPDLQNRAQLHILKVAATVRFHVMKSSGVRMGVHFGELSDENRKLLADWVDKTNFHK